MASYLGHRSRAAWNVSLWINNDEGLYRRAVELRRKFGPGAAARHLVAELPATTPDGYRYTETSVREALVDFGD